MYQKHKFYEKIIVKKEAIDFKILVVLKSIFINFAELKKGIKNYFLKRLFKNLRNFEKIPKNRENAKISQKCDYVCKNKIAYV